MISITYLLGCSSKTGKQTSLVYLQKVNVSEALGVKLTPDFRLRVNSGMHQKHDQHEATCNSEINAFDRVHLYIEGTLYLWQKAGKAQKSG